MNIENKIKTSIEQEKLENELSHKKYELENLNEEMAKENKQLKDNWNSLKDYIMNDINSRSQCKVVEYEDGRKVMESTSSGYILMQDKSKAMEEVLNKIQELEKGSDSNE